MSMEKPLPLSIASVPIYDLQPEDIESVQAQLLAYEGVYEVVVLPEEQRVYFKIDRKLVNEVALIDYIEQSHKQES